jgi:uncharacterized protein (TIGR03118 family)
MYRHSGLAGAILTAAVTAVSAVALSLGAVQAQGDHLVQTNLVSDIPGLATITDPQLINPWGVSHSPTSPFWVSNQVTSTATLYAVTDETIVKKVPINAPAGDVLIPKTAAGPQGPTGQVNNTNTSSFPVGKGGDSGPAHFIFANLNGTISAWDKGPTAFIQVTTPGAVYTGLAINGAQTRLYAANSTPPGRIDVFDSSFGPVDLGSSAFVDPSLPAGLVPFNVQHIGGDIYVTYAPTGRQNMTQATLGQGAVAIFDEDGNFIQELVSGGPGGPLAAPWGIAIAPPGFRRFSNTVLVGNFSFLHSEINAFIPSNGKLHGTIRINTGGLPAGGLWTLAFGVGGSNGSPDVLYFTNGINGEQHGLFGAIASHK